MALRGLARYEEAESELLTSYEQCLAKWGPEDPQVSLEKIELVALYEAWGRPALAEKYRTD